MTEERDDTNPEVPADVPAEAAEAAASAGAEEPEVVRAAGAAVVEKHQAARGDGGVVGAGLEHGVVSVLVFQLGAVPGEVGVIAPVVADLP